MEGKSKKKIFNIMELVCHVILLIGMMAFPYVEVEEEIVNYKEYIMPEGTYTFFSYMKQAPYIFATVFVVLIAINTIMCWVSSAGKSEKKDGIVHVVLAVIILIMGFLFYNAPYFVVGYNATPISFCKIVSLILLVAITIFAVLKRSNIAFPDDELSQKSKSTVVVSEADELKKYKDLFESGAITKEEYEAKKKQILGL